MTESTILYIFVGLMLFNFLASLVYLVGINRLRQNLRNPFHSAKD